MTREALKEFTMGMKEKDRAKNMFMLGFLYWMYNRDMENTIQFLKDKFGKKPEIYESNVKALQAGYNYGDTTETFTTTYKVEKAKMDPGVYRSIMGNQALSYGLIAASQKSGLPIIPGFLSRSLRHQIYCMNSAGINLSAYELFRQKMRLQVLLRLLVPVMAEPFGVTTTSGPGMALKAEAMGLAVMLEIPLIICDVQRGGPSTGLPTKTEQSDLLAGLLWKKWRMPDAHYFCFNSQRLF